MGFVSERVKGQGILISAMMILFFQHDRNLEFMMQELNMVLMELTKI